MQSDRNSGARIPGLGIVVVLSVLFANLQPIRVQMQLLSFIAE